MSEITAPMHIKEADSGPLANGLSKNEVTYVTAIKHQEGEGNDIR